MIPKFIIETIPHIGIGIRINLRSGGVGMEAFRARLDRTQISLEDVESAWTTLALRCRSCYVSGGAITIPKVVGIPNEWKQHILEIKLETKDMPEEDTKLEVAGRVIVAEKSPYD